MNKHIRYLRGITFRGVEITILIAAGLLITAYAFAETERIGKPDVVTAKKAKKDDMKTLLKDAKDAFSDQAQQKIIVKIIKELGGE
ncbi:MAG: hypothetical protein H7844_00580 [Nitrospirae bacterium YQR-1]